MELKPYTFAVLDKRQDLIQEIEELETALQRELGQEVTLIAYTHDKEQQK
jgi:hypothetical protein